MNQYSILTTQDRVISSTLPPPFLLLLLPLLLLPIPVPPSTTTTSLPARLPNPLTSITVPPRLLISCTDTPPRRRYNILVSRSRSNTPCRTARKATFRRCVVVGDDEGAMSTGAKWSRSACAWIPVEGIRGRIWEGWGRGGRVAFVEGGESESAAGMALLFASRSGPRMAPVGQNGVVCDDVCGTGDGSEKFAEGGWCRSPPISDAAAAGLLSRFCDSGLTVRCV